MAETVYKKVSELPSVPLPLDGSEYLMISKGGHSWRALWSGIFGGGWWAKLGAAFDSFVAPTAELADQADYCALAHDADAINGLSLVDGPTADHFGEQSINAGATWTPPKGTYIFSAAASQSTALTDLVIEVQDPTGTWQGRARFGGLLITSGATIRIRNSGTGARLVLFNKLA